MNGLISREKAYEVLTEYYHHKHLSQHIALKEALDRVPDGVIHCKDCKYWKESGYNFICNYTIDYHYVRYSNDYCSKGERKANNE